MRIKSKHEHGKVCPDCGIMRPREAFYKNKNHYDGLSTYCAKHQLERDRGYRETNAGLHRVYMRKYMQQVRSKPKNITLKAVQEEEAKLRQQSAPEPVHLDGPRCAHGKGLGCLKCKKEQAQMNRMKQAQATIAALGFAPAQAGD